MGEHHWFQSWVSSGDDCLTCLDTEDATVKLAHKKFCKKVWVFCGPTKQILWKDAPLEQIGNNHTTVWGSDYKAIKTQWDLTLDRDSSSFAVSEMLVHTDQLLQIKVATNAGNIDPPGPQGWCWQAEGGFGAVTQAIPHSLLLAIRERHDLCHGRPAGPSLRAMLSSALASLLVWDPNSSAPGASN